MGTLSRIDEHRIVTILSKSGQHLLICIVNNIGDPNLTTSWSRASAAYDVDQAS